MWSQSSTATIPSGATGTIGRDTWSSSRSAASRCAISVAVRNASWHGSEKSTPRSSFRYSNTVTRLQARYPDAARHVRDFFRSRFATTSASAHRQREWSLEPRLEVCSALAEEPEQLLPLDRGERREAGLVGAIDGLQHLVAPLRRDPGLDERRPAVVGSGDPADELGLLFSVVRVGLRCSCLRLL